MIDDGLAGTWTESIAKSADATLPSIKATTRLLRMQDSVGCRSISWECKCVWWVLSICLPDWT